MAQSPLFDVAAPKGPPARAGSILGVFLLAAALILGVGSAEARADEDEVFTIAGVKVDATAATAAEARDKALAEGQRKAMDRLFDRIVLAGDRQRLGYVKFATVAELVRDFDVTGEKTSSVRYLAELRVRFKPDDVRELLRGRNVGFAETRSKPLLVLPVYEQAGAYSLWGSPNPWRDAWNAAPQADGLVPLVRPRGDINDVAIIGAEQAVQGDARRLSAIARQYGTNDVLVAVAGFRLGAAGEAGQPPQPYLQVTLARRGSALAESSRVESFAVREGEAEDAALGRAVAVIAAQIQEDWKQSNRLRFGASRQLTAVAPLGSLADWLDLKGRLGEVAFIRQSDLIYLSRKEAWLRISYLGDEQQLGVALRQKDVVLERGPVSWILRRAARAGGFPGPGAAPALAPAAVPGPPPAASPGPVVSPSSAAPPAADAAPATVPAAPAVPEPPAAPVSPENAVGTP